MDNVIALINQDKNAENLNQQSYLKICKYSDIFYVMHVHPTDHIERAIIFNEVYPQQLLDFFIAAIPFHSKGAVLDIGANIGAFSIPLAKKYSNMTFHCYEPNPQVFDRLLFNLSCNGLDNAVTHKQLIYDKTCPTKFYCQTADNTNLGLSSTLLNSDIDNYEELTIYSRSLDEEFEHSNDVKFIKIDTQGSELNILHGASNLISRCRPIICFEIEWAYLKESYLKTIEDMHSFFDLKRYKLFYLNSAFQVLKPELHITGNFNGDVIAVPM